MTKQYKETRVKQLEKTYKLLEFNKILENIASFASLSYAKELLMQTKPFKDINKLNAEFDLVEQTLTVEETGKCNVNFGFEDIRIFLQKAKLSSLLSMSEILKVSKMIKSTLMTKNSIMILCDDTTPDLKELVFGISNQKNYKMKLKDASFLKQKLMTTPPKSFLK